MHSRKKGININLLIKEDFGQSFSEQFLSWALTYGRYIIIITQIIVLSVFFARFTLDRDHTDLKEAVSQKQAIVESVADLEKEIRRIQGKLSYIKNITANQVWVLNVLRFLQENTPTTVSYSTISLTSDKISFTAIASDLRSFNALIKVLQQNDKFFEVSLEDILRRPDGKVEFIINAKINPKGFV
ncbi:PilN domain-containing protein [Candidatus Gottesmanbacteria bacterium]|nr:PilN domain-containing protein [Candidatus Gottesmanbacteria bacterium]